MSGFVRFASTIWTVIRSARKDNAAGMDELVRLYRTPVVRYLRQRGAGPEQAEDLVQEVFLRIFQKDLLRKVEQAKGRFRSFLLGVTNNIAREQADRDRAQRRGGGDIHVPLDEAAMAAPAREQERFAREWMLHLVRLSMDGLSAAPVPAVRRDLEIFRRFIGGGTSYQLLAADFGVTPVAVKNALYETKRRMRDRVTRLINGYTLSREDFAREMEEFDALTGGRRRPTASAHRGRTPD